jgi:LysM repeat protein
MKTVKSAPSEWDDTTGSIGMDPQMKSPFPPLMKKLQTALVREGRVKELADDLKTLNDAEFMKKYGKAKAAIRADMKRVDEAGINRLAKKDFDFRDGLVGDDETGYETENEPELGMFRMGKPVEPNDAASNAFISALTPSQQDNRFTAPAGWRYVEKDEDPARYGSGPAAATSALPNLKYDPQSRTLKSADAPALDLSPKSKFKFDRTTQSQVPADGSGANANIDNATRDRARAYAAKQNTPATAAKQKIDWKTIYALNKATIGTNPNLIRPGMKLNMPDGSTYRVQPGDNLSKIAAKQSQINELSTEKLAQYKTAAAKDAREADKEGDFKRGDKRFSGIVKATKKQFDNDAKQVDESRAARRALMARIVNHR